MNLKIKAILVGSIAILCGLFAVILAFISIHFDFRYSGIMVFILLCIYSCLKDKYRKLRCKEIDEEYKQWRYDNINEELKWHDFNENQPTKLGLYNVKVNSSFFGNDYDNISGSVVRWNGKDFLLSTGRPITNEVLYWKEI